MKKIIFFLLLLLTTSFSFAQNDALAKEIIVDIIEHRPFRTGEMRISTNIKCTHLKKFITKIKDSKGIIYDEKTQFNKDSIHLTLKEQEYLSSQLLKQIDTLVWKKENIEPFQIISTQGEIIKFLHKPKSSLIEISHPLFIRKNEIALVFFRYTSYSNNYCNLNLYKKIKGV